MDVTQAIKKPFGVTVFGSSMIRVSPDIASLSFAVSRIAQNPRDAFRETHKYAQAVQKYLTDNAVDEIGISRVWLKQEYRYSGVEQTFLGYIGRITFNVLLKELDRVESIMVGVVDAGANEIVSIDYQTSRLKDIRAEARCKAVEAAKEKAEVYCKAADINLGTVVHIEDVNPDILLGTGSGHSVRVSKPDDEGSCAAYDPGSITVGAAVMIAFGIGQ